MNLPIVRTMGLAGSGDTDGTRLFTALSAALSDIPSERVAGAFEKNIANVEKASAALGVGYPVAVNNEFWICGTS